MDGLDAARADTSTRISAFFNRPAQHPAPVNGPRWIATLAVVFAFLTGIAGMTGLLIAGARGHKLV